MNYLEIKLTGISKDSDEKEYSLLDFKGKKIILYFNISHSYWQKNF